MRSAILRFILVSLLGPAGASAFVPVREARADWPPGGVLLTDSTEFRGTQRPDIIEPDGAGGVYVVWANYFYEDPDFLGEVHVQRVTMNGDIAPGWPAVDGLMLARSLGGLDPYAMGRDATDGVYVVWEDYRNSATARYDVYGSRVLSTGSIAPGWPSNGTPIADATVLERQPKLVPDATGGAYVAWSSGPVNSEHTRLTRILPTGSFDLEWPAGGLELMPSSYLDGPQRLLGDGVGNCIVILASLATSSSPRLILATRIAADGTVVPGWPADEVVVTPASAGVVDAIEDGSGGFYVVWEDYRSYPGQPAEPNNYRDIYALHWLADGTRDPRWPVDGLPICTAPFAQWLPRLVLAENRDLWIVWSDVRSYALGTGTAQDLYSMRVRPDGTRAPGWPVDGKPVMQTWDADQDGRSVTDGADGIYVLFEYQSQGYSGIQHVVADGSVDPEYGPDGELIPAYYGIADLPQIAWDGHRGVYVAWGEYYRPGYGNGEHVFLTHFGPPVPTAVAVSLVSSAATPEQVRLTWQVTEIARVTIERRSEPEEWQALGTAIADGGGRIAYEDATVEPGTRYAYRLAYEGPDGVAHSSESWIDVPQPYELALAGFRPNPATRGDVTVTFTLPSQAPGALEVLDVAGRRVESHDLSSLGAGRHTLRLDAGQGFHTGVYWLRLTHAGRAMRMRGVVLN